jgi:pimeloyl-ACP methyl ester carboxylesterase
MFPVRRRLSGEKRAVLQSALRAKRPMQPTTEQDSDLSTEPYSTIRLRDGRTVAYLEVGIADGFPIFHFHGHGSSRLEVRLLAEEAAEFGIRLIGIDRPGVGRSDPNRGARLMDWPEDIAAVADELGIERFAIEGISGGGPYALACAHKIPHRLTACGLVSTVVPSDLFRKAAPTWMSTIWSMAEHFPKALRFLLRLALPDSAPNVKAVERRLLRISSWLAEPDRTFLRTSELRTALARAIVEGRRQGSRAQREEAVTELLPWGFQIEETTFENIFLWHGARDRVIPIGPARLLAQVLPHCQATYYPDEGHFSVLVNHAKDISDALRG